METSVLFDFRNTFEKPLLEAMEQSGKIMRVKAGEVILESGQYIKQIPLILSGTFRVMRQDDDGNEILLYYVGQHETCAMSLTCCMAHQKSRIRAVAEEDCELFVLPVAQMDAWMLQYPSWKNFVMQTYSARFDELLRTIDGVAFRSVDQRLEKYLRDKSALTGTSEINVSHQQIAEALNSSREVISRLLKQLENEGRVALGRNRITLIGW